MHYSFLEGDFLVLLLTQNFIIADLSYTPSTFRGLGKLRAPLTPKVLKCPLYTVLYCTVHCTVYIYNDKMPFIFHLAKLLLLSVVKTATVRLNIYLPNVFTVDLTLIYSCYVSSVISAFKHQRKFATTRASYLCFGHRSNIVLVPVKFVTGRCSNPKAN